MTTDRTHLIIGASLRDGQVLAGMNVNVWDVNDSIQALVRAGQTLDKNALRDPGTPLESLAGH